MMISHPDLVLGDRAASESPADQHRENLPDGVYTGIWWHARFPDHYAGDGSAASHELGDYQRNWWIDSIARAVAAIKADDVRLKLQNELTKRAPTHWTRCSKRRSALLFDEVASVFGYDQDRPSTKGTTDDSRL